MKRFRDEVRKERKRDPLQEESMIVSRAAPRSTSATGPAPSGSSPSPAARTPSSRRSPSYATSSRRSVSFYHILRSFKYFRALFRPSPEICYFRRARERGGGKWIRDWRSERPKNLYLRPIGRSDVIGGGTRAGDRPTTIFRRITAASSLLPETCIFRSLMSFLKLRSSLHSRQLFLPL